MWNLSTRGLKTSYLYVYKYLPPLLRSSNTKRIRHQVTEITYDAYIKTFVLIAAHSYSQKI